MTSKANRLPFSVAFIWILFAFGKGSLLSTFNTQEGCNATLLCNQSGNVTWLNSTGQKIEDPRFTTLAFGYFSTLLISVVSKNDEGNIICIGQERNITINLEVCSDTEPTQSCSNQIQNSPDSCNHAFMIRNCKKSCGLCPECLETVLPTLPSPTGVNSGTSISTRPTTGSVAESSGASLSSGFQTLFALFFGLFSSSPILSKLK
ncbi:hypothetical protein ABFA07_002379 [Porites harrisoni]